MDPWRSGKLPEDMRLAPDTSPGVSDMNPALAARYGPPRDDRAPQVALLLAFPAARVKFLRSPLGNPGSSLFLEKNLTLSTNLPFGIPRNEILDGAYRSAEKFRQGVLRRGGKMERTIERTKADCTRI